MSNVGGSAGDGGFQFQAKIIAFVAVHMLAEATLTGLEQDIEGIPITVAAETNGPGDDIRIELTQPQRFIELQAKKGLHVDTRFDEAIEKIATGLCQDTTSSVVLAIDPTATGRIRQKLPFDLHRLRLGREDTPHDRDLFNRIIKLFAAHAKDDEETRELAKRFFVHVFDMEKADMQTALFLLRSNILLDEKQAKTAWNLLVQAGHELITTRSRYDAVSFARFLQNESNNTICLRDSLLPVAKFQYQAWLSANIATFRIPGSSGLCLPIEDAWTELQVLNKQDTRVQQDVEEMLRRYHEWERVASHADENAYNAKDVAEIGYRVVIAGGPGAGKSTLCRKLVYDLTSLEEIVMWIDLPSFANRIQNGININDALIDIATNGFDAPFKVREALLAQADCLIADGLDECGDLVVTVANALQRWATAHPFIRIVLTSRPIGYETRYFPDWEHYTLMPLTQSQVQSSSWKLIHALVSGAATVEKEAARFQKQLKNNHIASLAARNPLLLSFLIQLFLEGKALAQQRANLYEQVLNLWRVSLPQDRQWQVSQLDPLLAWRSLEIVGWLLLSAEKGQTARSHNQLVLQMSQQLAQEMDVQPLQAGAVANSCLQFWHERGILDCFQVGGEEIYTFVHTTFNEYTAGRYLARLSLAEIRTWVRDKYEDTRWRECILLAAGCGAVEGVVETLLEIDVEKKQATSVLLLAASALAESPTASDWIIGAVGDRLLIRLTDDNPTVVYEIAEQAAGLVKRVPILFASQLQPLFQHPHQWTSLSALYLASSIKESVIGAEAIETFLNTLSANPLPRKKRGGLVLRTGWVLQNKMIHLGSETLARIRPDVRTRSLLQTLYESKQLLNVRTQTKLRYILLDLGCDEFIREHDRQRREKMKDILDPLINRYQADTDRKVLETILQLLPLSLSFEPKRRKLRALSILLYALQLPETSIQDWFVLGDLDDIQAIEAVLSGYIEALHLNREELAYDAAWALAELQKMNQDGRGGTLLLSLLPNFPVSSEIPKLVSLNVPIQDLIRALHHPSSIIAYGAAQLLAAVGKGKEEIASLLLTTSDERQLHIIALIAGSLWGEEARTLLMRRLSQGYTPGIWCLVEELPSLPGEHTDQQFQHTLLRALQAEDPCIAIAAVHALQKLDLSLLRDMLPALQSALLSWTERGEKAKAESYYRADDCPTCNTTPDDACTHVGQLLSRL